MNRDCELMARRAIEALRSGVPNRDAVRQLPAFQNDITQKFKESIWQMQEASCAGDESARYMVISGGFGAGKSHLLEYLRHEALENRCVCSVVVISKETPLFDPLKLLRSAAETAVAPGKAGRAIPEILFADKLDPMRFVELFKWAREQPGLSDRVAPLLKILDDPAAGDEEFLDKIAWEWSGYPMKVSEIRAALKEIEQHSLYRVKAIPQRELGLHLWRFLPRLFHAAGYGGWVVLIDEVELMLRYSKLQRAKSYAQIARLAGMVKDFRVFGMLPVFSVTDDFWSTLSDWLKDSTELAGWLKHRGKPGDAEMAKDVEAGIKLLRRPNILRPARERELDELKEHLRELHSLAFGWNAPPAHELANLSSRSVREYVKSWIAEWDMMLLYPDYRSQIVVDEIAPDYSEDKDLSTEDVSTRIAGDD